MNNETRDFFINNQNDLETIFESIINLNSKSNIDLLDNKAIIVLQIIKYFESEAKIDILINFLNELNPKYVNFTEFVKKNITEITNLIKNEDKNQIVDLEWKFVTLSNTNKFENGETEPKIIVNLKFSNGMNKIFEADFANFKRLQEELEEGLNAFNQVYSKRVNNFTK